MLAFLSYINITKLPTGSPSVGPQDVGGMKKYTMFDQFLAMSWKWRKILQLPQNANRKSYT